METFQIEKSNIGARINPYNFTSSDGGSTLKQGQSFSPARDLSDLRSKIASNRKTANLNQTMHVRVSNSMQPATPNVQVIGNSIGGGIQRPSSLDKYPHTLPRTDFVDLANHND